ncbi:uncharacterized protein LOC130987089 isoform X2 [Salvia miltiorrhiza]|uniref:uncharacterized protein LOC130987089 isoform X2 n=1 Tax=Salvia miltiorrhiza TaxID=226208 RepID=UPI0025AC8CF6|nr:uncharacterized protein LOC130987089 isoform X2 [Salvia miltiorrhiza]
MDSPENSEEELRDCDDDDGTTFRRSLLRSCFAVAFAFLIILLLSFSVLYFAVLIGNLSIWSPISVQSRCRIVSSSVDLRSSKVCELGLLNYKAKHVFYPFERKKYRCHYDYYWASVFEVEYVDHSGQARFASAEAPNEALPYNCRPNFGAAWLTKDKFKVYKVTEVMVFQLGINIPVEMGSDSWSYFRLYNVLVICYLDWSCLPIDIHHSSTLCIVDIHVSPK